jgi:hypothetical protein
MLPINTVAVYDNIHLPKVQKQIQIDIKYRSGVYCFQHKVSGKLYIGSSFKLWTRFYEHVFWRDTNLMFTYKMVLENMVFMFSLY